MGLNVKGVVKDEKRHSATRTKQAVGLGHKRGMINRIVTKHGLFNAAAGATLFGIADGIAQGLNNETGTRQYDYRRLCGASVLGTMITGFCYPYGYFMLESLFPGRTFRTICYKSGTEIVTVSLFVNSLSMSVRGWFQGHDAADVRVHVWSELPRVTFWDGILWFPYNVVAFSVIPLSIRPFTTGLLEAGWQTYMSVRSHDYQESRTARSRPPNMSRSKIIQ